jgi:hypothetical protein
MGRRAGQAVFRWTIRRYRRVGGHRTHSRPIPVEFGVKGFYFRYERHFVYRQQFSNGDIGVVSILHDQMHQVRRLRDDLRY